MDRTRFVALLARHGETDWNALGRWQGQTDVPLNDDGRAQAMALGAALRGRGVRAIVSSDLARARETAEIAGHVLGLAPAWVDPDLRERGFGAFEGLTRIECAAKHPEAWARYAADPRTVPPGGEPQEHLIERMKRAVLRAARELPSPALVVSHGGAMRALVGALVGEPVGPIANGEVHEVIVDGDRIVEALRLGIIASRTA